jgi:hypothetical protein
LLRSQWRIWSVLFDMQNRTLGPYSTTTNRILISVMPGRALRQDVGAAAGGGAVAAAWFSEALGLPCCLVRQRDGSRRARAAAPLGAQGPAAAEDGGSGGAVGIGACRIGCSTCRIGHFVPI